MAIPWCHQRWTCFRTGLIRRRLSRSSRPASTRISSWERPRRWRRTVRTSAQLLRSSLSVWRTMIRWVMMQLNAATWWSFPWQCGTSTAPSPTWCFGSTWTTARTPWLVAAWPRNYTCGTWSTTCCCPLWTWIWNIFFPVTFCRGVMRFLSFRPGRTSPFSWPSWKTRARIWRASRRSRSTDGRSERWHTVSLWASCWRHCSRKLWTAVGQWPRTRFWPSTLLMELWLASRRTPLVAEEHGQSRTHQSRRYLKIPLPRRPSIFWDDSMVAFVPSRAIWIWTRRRTGWWTWCRFTQRIGVFHHWLPAGVRCSLCLVTTCIVRSTERRLRVSLWVSSRAEASPSPCACCLSPCGVSSRPIDSGGGRSVLPTTQRCCALWRMSEASGAPWCWQALEISWSSKNSCAMKTCGMRGSWSYSTAWSRSTTFARATAQSSTPTSGSGGRSLMTNAGRSCVRCKVRRGVCWRWRERRRFCVGWPHLRVAASHQGTVDGGVFSSSVRLHGGHLHHHCTWCHAPWHQERVWTLHVHPSRVVPLGDACEGLRQRVPEHVLSRGKRYFVAQTVTGRFRTSVHERVRWRLHGAQWHGEARSADSWSVLAHPHTVLGGTLKASSTTYRRTRIVSSPSRTWHRTSTRSSLWSEGFLGTSLPWWRSMLRKLRDPNLTSALRRTMWHLFLFPLAHVPNHHSALATFLLVIALKTSPTASASGTVEAHLVPFFSIAFCWDLSAMRSEHAWLVPFNTKAHPPHDVRRTQAHSRAITIIILIPDPPPTSDAQHIICRSRCRAPSASFLSRLHIVWSSWALTHTFSGHLRPSPCFLLAFPTFLTLATTLERSARHQTEHPWITGNHSFTWLQW